MGVGLILGLLAAGSVSAGDATLAAATPMPGYWETNNTATFLFSSHSTERKCLTATDVAKFMNGPSNRHYTCEYPSRAVGGGRIRLAGTCATKKGQIAYVTAKGTYSATTFKLEATLKTKIGGIPLSGSAITDAHRLGDDCPPASAVSK